MTHLGAGGNKYQEFLQYAGRALWVGPVHL